MRTGPLDRPQGTGSAATAFPLLVPARSGFRTGNDHHGRSRPGALTRINRSATSSTGSGRATRKPEGNQKEPARGFPRRAFSCAWLRGAGNHREFRPIVVPLQGPDSIELPDEGGGNEDSGQEGIGSLVVAGCDSTEILEPAEHPAAPSGTRRPGMSRAPDIPLVRWGHFD